MLTHHWSKRHLKAVYACQAKVCQFDLSSTGDQNVLGLQVSVNHTVWMKEVQPLQQLVHHILKNTEKPAIPYYLLSRYLDIVFWMCSRLMRESSNEKGRKFWKTWANYHRTLLVLEILFGKWWLLRLGRGKSECGPLIWSEADVVNWHRCRAGKTRYFKVLFGWASTSLQLSTEHLLSLRAKRKASLNAYEMRKNGLTAISSGVTCTTA